MQSLVFLTYFFKRYLRITFGGTQLDFVKEGFKMYYLLFPTKVGNFSKID